MPAIFVYTIVFVRDMRKSVAHYRDLIRLPVWMESPHWSGFPIRAGHCHTRFEVGDIE